MKQLITILLGLLFMSSLSFGINFDDKQKEHLTYACEQGKSHKYKDVDMCYVYAAIIWQESSAGKVTTAGPKHRSYGVFQNYVKTVRNRLKQQGISKTDKEIIASLQDRNESFKWAKEEMEFWLKARKGNLKNALASYNAGWNLQKGTPYANSVMSKINYLKKHPELLKMKPKVTEKKETPKVKRKPKPWKDDSYLYGNAKLVKSMYYQPSYVRTYSI